MQNPAIGELMSWARDRLRDRTETPLLDTQLLLEHITGKTRTEILAYPEYVVDQNAVTRFRELISDYLNGQALPYLLGKWEFYGRSFIVTPDVLIPRPETELLIEQALSLLKPVKTPTVLDVGTGSGIIALSLLLERPDCHAVAVDRSWKALQTASTNAVRHSIEERIYFVRMDLVDGLKGSFDLICANLPYIPSVTLAGLDVAGSEPREALDGGADGLVLIRRLLNSIKSILKKDGSALLEIEAGQGTAVLEYVGKELPFLQPVVFQDLAGRDRLLHLKFCE